MGMTIAEKILAAHSIPVKDKVKPGEYIWAKIDATDGYSGGHLVYKDLKRLGVKEVFDPDKIYVVDDHLSPPSNLSVAEVAAEIRKFVKEYRLTHWYEYGRHGILHQLFPEKGFCVPGDLIAVSDSHATTYGFLNAASCPVNIELLYIIIKGELWFRVPKSIKFWLTGELPEMCVGKDVILKIAADHGTDVALYRSAEFLGPLAGKISLDSRWTIANMGVEIGAKFAIFEADRKTFDFLRGRTDRQYNSVSPDPDARYEKEYKVDVSDLEPMVACPHDPGNAKPITEVEGEGVRIHQGFIGSCTNGRMEDLRMAAGILEDNKVHPDVRLIISPASMEVWRDALKAGLFDVFVDAGALVCHPTCGPCFGGHLGVLAAGERCISTTNRNFKGRMGSPESEVYLANAATVAASTIAGTVSDPRKYE